ncbi:MAG: DUF1697 domain-containing protein [Dehalococcoidia bacterium]|nr:DUF1697 domain-containing protein [Dehalococcoidia bacterium]
MAQLVALLRGVNVGGINIKMADLKRVFEDLGCSDVRTVLASGNVVFSTDTRDRSALKRRIEAALSAAFGYEAWVILVPRADLKHVIDGYPFGEEDDTLQPWVMFLAEPDVLADLLSVQADLDPAVERLQAGEGVLYWEVQKGQTVKSLFGKHSAKPRFKALTTTRNIRTLRKLLD